MLSSIAPNPSSTNAAKINRSVFRPVYAKGDEAVELGEPFVGTPLPAPEPDPEPFEEPEPPPDTDVQFAVHAVLALASVKCDEPACPAV